MTREVIKLRQDDVVPVSNCKIQSKWLGHRVELTDAATVINRLEKAGQTLLSLPNTGHTTTLRQLRHDHMSEVVEAVNTAGMRIKLPIPSPSCISRMDQALAWIPLIPADKLVIRRIVGCQTLVSPMTGQHLYTWRRLARLVGADHKAVHRWHDCGIDCIVTVLNRD